VYSTPRVHRPGGGSALVIEPEVLDDALLEHGLSANRLQLRRVANMSTALSVQLGEVFRLIGPDTSPLELQSAFTLFLRSVVEELVEHAPARLLGADDGSAAADVRERLHFDASARTDLATLSEQSGLSRFQVLRAFKRRYGMPPHAYQLNVRIALAKKALRAGRKPAEVAADYGFVDQSHFSRHFRQLVGVTPAQYMSPGAPTRSAASRGR
jgi:AraC-like DNA-binding protein